MKIHFLILTIFFVLSQTGQAESFEDGFRRSVFGDRVRRAMNGESEPQSAREEAPKKEPQVDWPALEGHLGTLPSLIPATIEFTVNGDSYAEVRVESEKNIHFKFFKGPASEFSLHLVETGFFVEGGPEALKKMVRGKSSIERNDMDLVQGKPEAIRKLHSDLSRERNDAQRHLNNIYKTSTLIGEQLKIARGPKQEITPELKTSFDILRSSVPNGWTAQYFYQNPLEIYSANQEIWSLRFTYDYRVSVDTGEIYFYRTSAMGTNLSKHTPEVFGLGKEHAERLYDAFPTSNHKSWQVLEQEDDARTLGYKELVASGEWKHWRYSKEARRYLRDYEFVYQKDNGYWNRYETKEMRELREARPAYRHSGPSPTDH